MRLLYKNGNLMYKCKQTAAISLNNLIFHCSRLLTSDLKWCNYELKILLTTSQESVISSDLVNLKMS